MLLLFVVVVVVVVISIIIIIINSNPNGSLVMVVVVVLVAWSNVLSNGLTKKKSPTPSVQVYVSVCVLSGCAAGSG